MQKGITREIKIKLEKLRKITLEHYKTLMLTFISSYVKRYIIYSLPRQTNTHAYCVKTEELFSFLPFFSYW